MTGANGETAALRHRQRLLWHRAQGRLHFTKVTPTRSSSEFADFLLAIAAHYPAADTIHLVMDKLSTHSRKALLDRFGEAAGCRLPKRFSVHHTPKHGSWLNQAEIEMHLFRA
jgi:DDE superfamily endonuclease